MSASALEVRVDAVLAGRAARLGDRATSAIVKTPVDGPVEVGRMGLLVDEQADPRHHGGPDKALHHYPRERYSLWFDWAPHAGALRQPGAFGENLSTTGMTEDDVCLGDVFSLGAALLQVSQGRQPCWKLDLRLGRRGTARRMQDLQCTGWYYRVLTPGFVAAGDTLTLTDRPHPDWPLSRLLTALFDRSSGPQEWRDAAALPALSDNWRHTFAERLARGRIENWAPRLGDADRVPDRCHRRRLRPGRPPPGH